MKNSSKTLHGFLNIFKLFTDENEAVSKACHPALDAGSPKKELLIFRGLRVDPESSSGRNDIIVKKVFETAFCPSGHPYQ